MRQALAPASPVHLSPKSPTEARRRQEAQEHAQTACDDALRWVDRVCRLAPLTDRIDAEDVALIVREAEAVLGMRLDLICTIYRCRDVVDATCERFMTAATDRAGRILTRRLDAAAHDASREDWIDVEVLF